MALRVLNQISSIKLIHNVLSAKCAPYHIYPCSVAKQNTQCQHLSGHRYRSFYIDQSEEEIDKVQPMKRFNHRPLKFISTSRNVLRSLQPQNLFAPNRFKTEELTRIRSYEIRDIADYAKRIYKEAKLNRSYNLLMPGNIRNTTRANYMKQVHSCPLQPANLFKWVKDESTIRCERILDFHRSGILNHDTQTRSFSSGVYKTEPVKPATTTSNIPLPGQENGQPIKVALSNDDIEQCNKIIEEFYRLNKKVPTENKKIKNVGLSDIDREVGEIKSLVHSRNQLKKIFKAGCVKNRWGEFLQKVNGGAGVSSAKRDFSTICHTATGSLGQVRYKSGDCPKTPRQFEEICKERRIDKFEICCPQEKQYQPTRPCPCVEGHVAYILPKLKRLQKCYNTNMAPPKFVKECVIPGCAPRADDKIKEKPKCLPPMPCGNCKCVEPYPLCECAPLRRLPKAPFEPPPPPCEPWVCPPRADDCVEPKCKELKYMPPSKCPCYEGHVPYILPKMKRLQLAYNINVQNKFEEISKCIPPPCPPRADASMVPSCKKLPCIKSDCVCVEPPPLIDSWKLRRLEKRIVLNDPCPNDDCVPWECPPRADDLCKLKIKRKHLKCLLPCQPPCIEKKCFSTYTSSLLPCSALSPETKRNFFSTYTSRMFHTSTIHQAGKPNPNKNCKEEKQPSCVTLKTSCPPRGQDKCMVVREVFPSCSKTNTPYKSFSECAVFDYPIPQSCCDDLKPHKYLQPKFPIIDDFELIRAAPPLQKPIDPTIEERCILKQQCRQNKGFTQGCDTPDSPTFLKVPIDASSRVPCEGPQETGPCMKPKQLECSNAKPIKLEKRKTGPCLKIVSEKCDKPPKSTESATKPLKCPKKPNIMNCQTMKKLPRGEKPKMPHRHTPKSLVDGKPRCSKPKENLCGKPPAECPKKKLQERNCQTAKKARGKLDEARSNCEATKPEKKSNKSVVQTLIDYFKAKPGCPDPDAWKQDLLKQRAEKAAKAAGMELVDPKQKAPKTTGTLCKQFTQQPSFANTVRALSLSAVAFKKKEMDCEAVAAAEKDRENLRNKAESCKLKKAECNPVPEKFGCPPPPRGRTGPQEPLCGSKVPACPKIKDPCLLASYGSCPPRGQKSCNKIFIPKDCCYAPAPYTCFTDLRPTFKRVPYNECTEQDRLIETRPPIQLPLPPKKNAGKKPKHTCEKRDYSTLSAQVRNFATSDKILSSEEISKKILELIQVNVKELEGNSSNAKSKKMFSELGEILQKDISSENKYEKQIIDSIKTFCDNKQIIEAPNAKNETELKLDGVHNELEKLLKKYKLGV